MMQDKRYIIGIDPGVKTGVAVWDRKHRKFDQLITTDIDTAWSIVQSYQQGSVLVVIENPNLRTWFGNSGKERYQGAGSVKRDFSIWKKRLEITVTPYVEKAPKAVMSIPKHSTFKAITGCQEKRTSQHVRDAAMMVFDL